MRERCVHCLADGVADTKDHWLPRGWYSSMTAADLHKWSFPSCNSCNNELSRVEDRLRARLVLALDPNAPAAQGVAESVRRSMDPASGKNPGDSAARAARLAAIERDLIPGHLLPADSVLPGLSWRRDIPIAAQAGTTVGADDLNAFVHKLVRGLTFIELGAYIEPSHKISMHLLAPEQEHIFTRPLSQFGHEASRPPALRCYVARTREDQICAMYEFLVWDRLGVFAMVRLAT